MENLCLMYVSSLRVNKNHKQALHGVGGACALALVGSAISDVAGFAIIATSSMGLFNTFGLFSAIMIVLSLIASMVITTAALGLMHQGFSLEEESELEAHESEEE